jgi:hypothetical protein
MPTLKRKNTDGNWEYIQVSGLDVSQLRDDVDLNTTALAESATKVSDYTPQKNKGSLVFGQEYLSAFHKKIMSWSTGGTTLLNAVFSGDSTTAGDSTSGVSYHIDQLIKDMSLKSGFPFINAVNNGNSGKDTEHWNQTYVNNDLAANPDILVLRWGINDPYYSKVDNSMLPDQSTINPTVDAQRRTVIEYEASLRSGLTKIRASKTQSQLSIILMVPNSVSDTPNGRNQKWIESLVPVIQKAARDFQCCFINNYQFLQDSVNASDFMDNPYGDGRHIHPNDVMNLWIVSTLFDIMFPKGLIGKLSKNNVVNDWNGNTIKSITDVPNTYPYGLSMYRTTNAPINGILITFRASDEVLFQINHGYDMSLNGYSIRLGHSVSNTWSSWNTSTLEAVSAPTLVNSWVNYDTANGRNAGYYKDGFGIIHLQGLIRSGTSIPGTTLFTLPIGYRPTKSCYFPVSSNNAFGSVSVDVSGEVAIQSGSNTWLSLDGISFRP